MTSSGLGLKIGIEIHQQLDSAKLFCNCPSRRSEPPDRPGVVRVIGETTYSYFAAEDCTCPVDLGVGKPVGPDADALRTVLMVSRMIAAQIEQSIVFERKAILGGSNPAGFQRTAVVARGGEVDGIGIESICLEEDAGRRFHESAGEVHYNLDRQGIPLAEITTRPDIASPDQAGEIAESIGTILRSTGAVRRGLGTIRQDLNVSLAGGARVELKGVQDLRHIPEIIENEVNRQLTLDEVRGEIRRVHDDLESSFLRDLVEASLSAEPDVEPLTISSDLLESIAVPERLDHRMVRFQDQYGLTRPIARVLVAKELDALFEELAHDHDKGMVQDVLTNYGKESPEHLRLVVEARSGGALTREMVQVALEALARGEPLPETQPMDPADLDFLIDQVLEKRREFVERKGMDALGAVMGLVMQEVQGRVEGRVVSDLLRQRLSRIGRQES